ncbi:MAG: MFS transporter [Bacillota bacterium]
MSGTTNDLETKAGCAAPRPPFKGSYERILHNIKCNTFHGILNIAALNLVGPFFAIFLIKLGADKMQVALLSSAPAAVSLLAMIPGAFLIEKNRQKKKLTILILGINRLFYLAMVFIPVFAPSSRSLAFIALVALMNLPGAIGNVAWQSFIAEIIPSEKRAEAFAARNRWMNLAGVISAVGAGFALDRMGFPWGYQVFFILAFMLSMVELYVLNQIREEPHREAIEPSGSVPAGSARTSAAGLLKEIFAEKKFLRFTLASVFFYFAWQSPWPLFNWYLVKELNADAGWISLINLISTGGSFYGYGFWARISGKHGHLKTLYYASLGMFILPAGYAFSRSLFAILILNLIIGAVFSGVNLALFNTLLDAAPEARKTSFIACYNTAINISCIIAPLAGMSMLYVMNFRWAFLTCAAMRIIGSFFLLIVDRANRRDERQALFRGISPPAG